MTELSDETLDEMHAESIEAMNLTAGVPPREADLHIRTLNLIDALRAERVHNLLAIQHAVMANAAARAYPDTYRALGAALRTEDD
jgi:hypothetical protein